MRVLHIVPSLDPKYGGPSRVIPGLCQALVEAGAQVETWTFRGPGQPETVGEHEDWPIRRFPPLPGTAGFPQLGFVRALQSSAADFDLVHLHALWNPKITVAAAVCRRAQVPYVISPHGMLQTVSLSVKWPAKRVFYRAFEKATIEGASAIHFLTEHEAEESTRLVPASMRKLIVANGIDPALGRGVEPGAFRRDYPQLQGKRLLLFLGRLHWSKGLELQLDMLSRLVRQMPEAVWVLVGPDVGEWSALSRQIRQRRLEPNVVWTGPLPWQSCLEALADADLFLLTSRHEAHSMAMNEALGMGVPVLLTPTVRFNAVEEWGAGQVVEADAEQFARTASAILSDAGLAAKMRLSAKRMAAELLAWPKVAEAMLRGYEAALGRVACVPACAR